MSGRVTPATVALDRADVRYSLHSYRPDPRAGSYGEVAAAALGVDSRRIFKTLVASVDGRLAVGVVPVAASLDLKAFAAAVGGKKGALADPAQAARATGYVLGGISPLGLRRALPTVMDSSATDHPTVFISAGRRGLHVELGPTDLIRLTGGVVVAIAG